MLNRIWCCGRAWRCEFYKILEEFKILLLNILVHQKGKQGPDSDLNNAIANTDNSTEFN